MKKIILIIIMLSISLSACTNNDKKDTEIEQHSTIKTENQTSETATMQSVETTIITTATTTTTEETIVEKAWVRDYELIDFEPKITFKPSEYYEMNWDNDELTAFFDKAAFIKFCLFDYLPYYYETKDIYTDDNYIYTCTGYNYDSFCEYVKTVFTDEYFETLISLENPYKNLNVNGELLIWKGDRGSNIYFDTISFSIESETESKIIIKGTAKYWHSDFPDEEEFIDYYYNIVNTENGWRFNNFEIWN